MVAIILISFVFSPRLLPYLVLFAGRRSFSFTVQPNLLSLLPSLAFLTLSSHQYIYIYIYKTTDLILNLNPLQVFFLFDPRYKLICEILIYSFDGK
jgi:hypothetical protein